MRGNFPLGHYCKPKIHNSCKVYEFGIGLIFNIALISN